MVAPGIYHVKARLVDLIGSSGIENATSAQPKNLASAPRLSPLRFFGGVAGDETSTVGSGLISSLEPRPFTVNTVKGLGSRLVSLGTWSCIIVHCACDQKLVYPIRMCFQLLTSRK